MAQRDEPLRRKAIRLASRYGLRGKAVIVAVCACLVVGLGAVGIMRAVTSQGLVIVRDEADGATSEQMAMDAGPTARVEEEPAQTEESSSKASDNTDAATVTPDACMLVHVDGAVAQPGVYEVRGTSPRINDAVSAAGGLVPEADTSTINLAAPLADGQKIHVPTVEEVQDMSPDELPYWDGATDSHDAATSTDAAAATGTESGLININTATEEELQKLPGVGEATARAIVEDRKNNGSFASPEDLMRISGIGEKKFAKMRDLVCV